ncbi:hypothetical protein EV421DRAFT_1730853 [Armillaria borealis]|uniref:Acetyl-CoA synthetase-like protein n=1 Tax=Armillaria borealis TaxID=47425 RepID=A0AA39K5P1_9AGAR|nr:hypothetical protein EV421DRAFT_1730853 [Armillaria borealis]
MSFSEHQVIPPLPQKQGEQSTTFLPPLIDGSFTVQQMYDWHLHHSPNHRMFVYAREDGSLRNIYWAEAVTAAYTCARLMNNRILFKGKPPVVAILSMSDTITYTTTVMGLQRANYVIFPISPRNSAPAVAHLLHEVGVEHVLVGRDSSMQVLCRDALDILGSQYPSSDLPQLSPVPVFEDLFLPDWRTRTNSDDLPLLSVDPSTAGLYLHSSGSYVSTCLIQFTYISRIGSTSYPKPITWNCHRLIEHTLVPWFGARDLCDVVFAVHSLPASSGLVLGVFEPKTPATSPMLDNMIASAKAMNSDIVFCVPYILEALSREPEYIDWLSTRSGVLYGGGPLDKEAGDNLTSRGVSIFVLYGTTECGVVTPILPAKASDCWDYFEFTKFATPKMVANGPDSFEFIAVKNEFSEPSVINTNVDGAEGFATSDLFTPHSTQPGYWKIIGRIDDQIMHNTGEKTNPGPLEGMLNQDLHVLAAVMFGRGKYQMIIVTKPGRPLTYTAKNTVRRQAALNDYSAEIETLYKTVEDSTQAGILPPLEWDGTSTQEFVRNVVLQTLTRQIPDNADLFQHGCDRRHGFETPSFTHYEIPPVSILANSRTTSSTLIRVSLNWRRYLVSVAQGALTPGGDATSRVDAMHEMVQRYSKDFPTISQSRAPTLEAGKIVLVTGTTGGLGYRDPYLRRRDSSKHLHDHGLDVNMTKVTMLEVDLSVETLVLDQASTDHLEILMIINSVTHIIHNAWRVDFNLGIVLHLSLISEDCQARLVYTSSIGVFMNAPEDHPLAEAPVNATVAQGTGYNESKWVSEELLRLAPSLRYVIVRVGQLTGGPKGTWKIKEWVPSMIQSSTVLGFLPDDDKCVSWLPVHIAAQLLVDHIDNSIPIMHLVHPKPVSWSTLARFASQELNVKLVSYTHWLEALENSTLDATVFPAMRILTYYKRCAKIIGLRNREAFGLPRLSTTSIQEASIPPLDENEVRNWLQYWREAKMLN